MLTDSLWNLTGASPGQAITATAASTNYVDLGALGIPALSSNTPGRDLGKGQKITLLTQVTETFLTLTSLKVAIQGDSDSGFGTAVTVLESEAIAVASLLAGYRFSGFDIVPRGFTYRYLRAYFTVAGSNATAGKVFMTASLGNQDGF